MKIKVISDNYSVDNLISEFNKRFTTLEDMQARIEFYSLEIAENFDLQFRRKNNVLLFADETIDIDSYLLQQGI